jgi:hypothetical protein
MAPLLFLQPNTLDLDLSNGAIAPMFDWKIKTNRGEKRGMREPHAKNRKPVERSISGIYGLKTEIKWLRG